MGWYISSIVMQVDRLLGPGIDNIIEIWNRPTCPHMRLIQISSTDLEAKERQPKDEGKEDSDEDEEDWDGDSIQTYSDTELSEDEDHHVGKEETKEEEEPIDQQGKLRYHSLR